LDEITAHLDNATSREVNESIRRIVSAADGRTVMMNTHRLEHCVSADRIIVMERGVGIRESGTHEELMQRRDGAYRRLVSAVMSEDDGEDAAEDS